jgi:hypothetical protein
MNYQDTVSAMHVRTINITLQEYLFVLQVVMGEDIRVAYASVYDTDNFKRFVPSEEEEDYLAKIKKDAQVMLEQQNCSQLRNYLEEEYQSAIQSAASTLEDYKFTGADIQRLLSNLLHNRSESLDDASVKDILSLVKSMFDSGYLDSDEAWERHFITIPRKFNSLCTSCNHELYAVDGLDCVCQHCGQVYKWVESEKRFYPQMSKL